MNYISMQSTLDEQLVEFISPLFYFIAIFGKETNFIFCYPRITSTEKQFISSLNIYEHLIEKSSTTDLLTAYIADFINEKLIEKKTQLLSKIKSEKDLVFYKRSLSKTREFSLLERHYINSNVRQKDLRNFIEELIKQIINVIPDLDPKIVHQDNRYQINETIANIPIFGSTKNEKMNLDFCINMLINKENKKETIEIVLSFYLKDSTPKFGIEINSIFINLYDKFNNIITNAINRIIDN